LPEETFAPLFFRTSVISPHPAVFVPTENCPQGNLAPVHNAQALWTGFLKNRVFTVFWRENIFVQILPSTEFFAGKKKLFLMRLATVNFPQYDKLHNGGTCPFERKMSAATMKIREKPVFRSGVHLTANEFLCRTKFVELL
jgi:hypothetical protein